MWRRRNFRLLLELIDRLPRDTHYRQAVSLDKEMAEAFMQLPEADAEPDNRPMMSEDGTLAIALRDIGNQLRLLRSERAGAKLPLLEGPKTIYEKAAFTRRQKDHYALTARLLPHKAAEMQAKIEQLE